MSIYDVLKKYISTEVIGSREKVIFCEEAKKELENENDRYLYNLIKNVSSIYAKVAWDSIEFQPAYVFDGKRSFAPEDLAERDYLSLESLELELLPQSICAKIADFLWVERKNFKAAQIAASTYFQLFQEYFSDEDWIGCMDYIYRAIYISAQTKQNNLHGLACKTVFDHIVRLDGSESDFLSLRLIEIMIAQKYGDVDILLSILDKIICNSFDYETKVELAYEFKCKCMLWKKTPTKVKEVRLELAQYYEKKASYIHPDDFRTITMAERLLQKAVFIYRDNGETNEAERLQRKIVELQKKIPDFLPVKTRKYDVSKLYEFVKNNFDKLSFEESIIRLTQFTCFRKKEDVKKQVLIDLKEFPLSHFWGKCYLNASGQTVLNLKPLDIHDPESDPLLLDMYIHQKMLELESTDGNLFLKRALYCIEEKNISFNDLDFLIKNNAIIPYGRERIFQSAIHLALNKKYYEAIHILAPQIENLFRNLARELNALTVTLESDGTSKEKVLSSVFDLPELLEAYDNDILFIFKGLLNEKAGANIRNNVAHGILTDYSSNEGACIYFICAVIKLLSFTSVPCKEIYKNSKLLKEKADLSADIVPVPINE